MQGGMQVDQGGAVGSAATPALRFIPNSEIEAKEKKEFEERQNQVPITSLAGHLKSLWQAARTAKEPVQQEILADYQARNGKYTEAKLAEIKQFGGSCIYMMLTNEKCRGVEAHMKDVFVPPDDKPWTIETTPIVDLSEDEQIAAVQQVMAEAMAIFEQSGMEPDPESLLLRTQQLNDQIMRELEAEAKQRAERMERQIEDQMAEGNWDEAIQEWLYDLSTTKKAILKGPVVKRRKKMRWMKDANGRWKPQVTDGFRLEWERRSPLDIYPSPDATHLQNGYLFDRYQFHLDDIQAMRGLKGVDEAALDHVIERYGRSGYKTLEHGDQQRANVEQRRYAYWAGYSSTIEALQFWGAVPGYLLQEWGMEVDEKYGVYHVQAWLIGDVVVKATINEDPLGRRPYHGTSFEKLPGSFWGRGPSELLTDYQDMVNAIGRAIVNNTAMASGPMVSVNDSDRLATDEDPTAIYPWRVWQFRQDKNAQSHRPPIEFYQPNPMVDMLLKVYEFFSQRADTAIGLPSYPMGELQDAAGKTASGMSMALNQATKSAKSVIKNADVDVIESTVQQTYEFNMLYNPDESIKGDLKVVARGASALMLKEHQQMRRQEFLDRTNNPVDTQIMGIEGRANLLREVAKSMDIPIDDVIPHLENQELVEELMKPGGQAGGQSGGQAAGQTGRGMMTRHGGSRGLDAAGNPAGGQDTAIFQQ